MANKVDPLQQQPLQPGLDPTTTGKPHQSDPKKDVKPGQQKKPGDPNYRPEK